MSRKPVSIKIGGFTLVKPSITGKRGKVWISKRGGEAGDFCDRKLAAAIKRFFEQEF